MISPATIALVKERTDVVALIGETVKLTRRGRSFVGLCPFHKEKTPSFHVNAERGFFHCFGCKESGSAVDFVMKLEGQTFAEAIRSLAQRSGVDVEETLSDAERREAVAARRGKDDLYAANQLAATFFEQSMQTHPLAHHAHTELGRRGLAVAAKDDATGPVADALQAFRVGYAPYGWDGLTRFFKQQGVSPVLAERVGLIVPRSSGTGHYDRFRHRLMFAVIDVLGRVVAFSGRALADPAPSELASIGLPAPTPSADGDRGPAKYVNSPESPIYTKGEHLFGLYQARQAIRQAGEGILVEGNFDVVSLHARGIANVVAPLGTAFTTEQAKLLKRFAAKVVVLFDGDEAGRKATRASRGACREGGLIARVASLPSGSDPDDFVRQRGAETLAHLVANASGMLEFLLEDALDGSRFGAATFAEQLARIRAAAALLSEEDDPNLRAMAKLYADRLSSKLIVDGRAPTDLRELERILDAAVAKPPSAEARRAAPPRGPDEARSRANVEAIGMAILGALIDVPALLDEPDVQAALGALEGDAAIAIAALRHARSLEKGLYAGEFLAQIAAPIHPFAAGRLASPVFETAEDARNELFENARKLKRLSLLRENAAVVDQLHRAEALGDRASEDALLREVERRSREKLGLAR